jgi:hypothetical protein
LSLPMKMKYIEIFLSLGMKAEGFTC